MDLEKATELSVPTLIQLHNYIILVLSSPVMKSVI